MVNDVIADDIPEGDVSTELIWAEKIKIKTRRKKWTMTF